MSASQQLLSIENAHWLNHDQSKKQILILGYYGEDNYGDELMLSCLLKRISKSGVNAEVSVCLFPSQNYPLSRWKGVHCYLLPTSEETLPRIADYYDEVIIGGGAHIDDEPINSVGFLPYLARKLSLLALSKKKDVKWIAVSTNRCLKEKDFLGDLQTIVDGSSQFSVRDKFSFQALIDSGLNVSNVTLQEDLAFDIDAKKKWMLVILNLLHPRDELVVINQQLVDFCRERGYGIYYLPFLNVKHLDVNLYLDIMSRTEFYNVQKCILPEFTSVESLLPYFKAADIVFSMKYHSSLLSLHYGIPTLSFVVDHKHYHNKMNSLHEKYSDEFIIQCSDYLSNCNLITEKLSYLSSKVRWWSKVSHIFRKYLKLKKYFKKT